MILMLRISILIISILAEGTVENCTAVIRNPASGYFKEELSWVEDLREHLNHVMAHLQLLKRHNQWAKNITSEISSKRNYLGNAMNSFSLLKRSAKDWQSVSKIVIQLPGSFNPTRKYKYNNKWFNYFSRYLNTLEEVANITSGYRGLSRLQNVYHISADTLANAKLEGALSHSMMSADDCFEFAKYYFTKEFDYEKCIEWLDQVMKINSYNLSGICERDVTELYYFAYCYKGDIINSKRVFKKLSTGNAFFKPSTTLEEEYSLIMKYGCGFVGQVTAKKRKKEEDKKKEIEEKAEMEAAKSINDTILEKDERLDEGDPALLELCNYPAVNNGTKNYLKCRYVHYNKPELKIGPFKMEEFHLDPPVLMFHDVFSDQEIEDAVKYATPRMRMAEVTTDSLDDEYDETSRTSYHMWIEDYELPLSARLSRRTALFTGWDLYMAEPNQVASYGIAGEFRPHVDAMETIDTDYADYSVVMYYLNTVAKGGHTIFPVLNVSVVPVKGSAVLWFNRRPDGAPDQKSMHGGCPVLEGTKWVMNKWFHVRRQHFPKCTKEKNSSFKYFYV